MKIPFGKPIIDKNEFNNLKNVLNSNILTHGPISKEFEKKFSDFTKLKNSITTSSCTSALYLAYKIIGLKKGDEFIVPAQTHVATINAGLSLGAKPVFVDASSKDGNINISKIKAKISKKTKCLTIVHFLGKPIDIKKIKKITDEYKIRLVEDCALSLGAKYYDKHVGYYSDFACFSFYPAKHITTGDGGMLYCKKKNDLKKAELLRGFGVNKTFFERKVPGIYDVIECGLNFRLSDINSSIGIAQLKKLNFFLKRREKNYRMLAKNLKTIQSIRLLNIDSEKNLKSSYYCLSFIVKNKTRAQRDKYLSILTKKGIGCSVYYPRAIMDYTYFKKKILTKEKFDYAREISDKSICIPTGPHLNLKHINYMIKEIKKIF